MKRKDVKPCKGCGKGVAHAGPAFFAMKARYWGLDPRGIQQTHGLELQFGGGQAGAVMANIMGADPDLAQPLSDEVDAWVCLDCATRLPLAVLLERD
ncbi:hypothetical protein [Luteimonas saliphila]|uniref:hypothetical protein n=1 Tax=Luteimonas saliphila TaxID=2804919 RepID=UPI00192E1CDB|nr:hypothetical protein [Luteimonas saliphila]